MGIRGQKLFLRCWRKMWPSQLSPLYGTRPYTLIPSSSNCLRHHLPSAPPCKGSSCKPGSDIFRATRMDLRSMLQSGGGALLLEHSGHTPMCSRNAFTWHKQYLLIVSFLVYNFFFILFPHLKMYRLKSLEIVLSYTFLIVEDERNHLRK